MQKQVDEIRFLTNLEWTALEQVEKNARDTLIIDLLYITGCTVNELVNMRLKDFSLPQRILKIGEQSSRNHEPRVVFLSKKIVNQIRSFLRKEHPGPDSTPYILATRQSPQMTTKRVRQIVQKTTEKAGIKDKNSPQILRYTHIVHAFEKGVPIPSIQKQVGIKRSRAIQIFNELKSEADQDAYKKFLE